MTVRRRSSRKAKLRLLPTSDVPRYRHHEYAGLFPLLQGEDLQALAGDIKANGLLIPIVIHDGKILDGRNRYRACKKAGVDPRFETFEGTASEALDLVVSLNLARRHLITSQRAAIALELLPLEQKLAHERMKEGGKGRQRIASPGKATDAAGSRVGVSGETVRQAALVAKMAPELARAMRDGIVRSVPEARKLATADKTLRRAALKLMKTAGLRADEAIGTAQDKIKTARKRRRKHKAIEVREPHFRLIYGTHVIDALRGLSDASVHSCCTSPPFYGGLRDYDSVPVKWADGSTGHLGREPTPEAYVEHIVEVMEEVGRVLRPDGTLWLNIGDSHASSPARGTSPSKRFKAGGRAYDEWVRQAKGKLDTSRVPGLKPKDLIGIPWRVALALRDLAWYLRSDIIWQKPSILPESVQDRVTQSHEYIFMLSRSERYFYDSFAIREPSAKGKGGTQDEESWRSRRSVWTVPTQPFGGAHFATWPPKLPELMILAGTSAMGACGTCGTPWRRIVEADAARTRQRKPHSKAYSSKTRMGRAARRKGVTGQGESGTGFDTTEKRSVGWTPTCRCKRNKPVPCTVLDPFSGSGTTGMVALQHGRDYIGIDLNADYLEMAEERIKSIESVE